MENTHARLRRSRFGVVVGLTILVPAVAAALIAPGRILTAHAASATVTEYSIPTTGSAPTSIVKGPDSNLWFTESSGNKIGKITTAGAITEYALPTSGSAPQTITAGPDGNLWFTEAGNNSVGRITTSGTITEFAVPSTNSKPWGITSGPDGNVWFTEQNSGKVGRITTSGTISEYAGGCGLGTIIQGPDANLWFVDLYCGSVGRISIGGSVTEFNIGCCLNDIAAGADGNIWLTDGDHNSGLGVAVKIATDGTGLTEYHTPTAASSQPQGITSGPNGALWMTDSSDQIVESTTSGVMTDFPLPTTGVNASGITSGPDGNMWFTETSGNAIGTLTIPASCSTYFATASHAAVGPGMQETITLTMQNCGGSASLSNVTSSTTTSPPSGCPAAPALTELSAASIAPGQGASQTTSFPAPSCLGTYTVSSAGSVGTTVVSTEAPTYAVAIGASVGYANPGAAAGGRPSYITTGSDGNLWFTESGGPKDLVRLTPSGAMTQFATPRGGPQEVAAGPDGNIWTADGFGSGISAMTTSGGTVLAVPVPGVYIESLTAGPDGAVWFIARNFNTGGDIGRVTTTGGVKLFAIPSPGYYGGITAGPDGALWFTVGGQIGRITTAGVQTLFTIPSGAARDIALGPDGNLWYTNYGSSTIGRVTPTGVITEFATPSAFSGPAVLTPAADGNVWFTEVGHVQHQSQLGRITPAGVITEFPIADYNADNAQFGIAAGPDGNLWTASYYGFVIGQIGIGLPPVCAPLHVVASPSRVASGATETVAATVSNCATTPALVKLAENTKPPSTCGSGTTFKVSTALSPLVGTTTASSFAARHCKGVYTVKATLFTGTTVIATATTTYQVT